MIYSGEMQGSISRFTQGAHHQRIDESATIGDAAGVLNIGKLYKRRYVSTWRQARHLLGKRSSDATNDYQWHGSHTKAGFPMMGDYSGFPGTLSQEKVPISNAFLTGILWLLAVLACIPVLVGGAKLAVEALNRVKKRKIDKLEYFRIHWLRFVVFAVLRTTLIAFFMLMLLTLSQFTLRGNAGVTSIAAVVFIAFFVGILSVSGYAFYCRLSERFTFSPDYLVVGKGNGILGQAWPKIYRKRQEEQITETQTIGNIRWWKFEYAQNPKESVHDDEPYLLKFGWLYARFRRRRWYAFAIWVMYEFIRACFYGGAAGNPRTQVFGILAVEMVALAVFAWMKPFESTRLNVLTVYTLGFSKITTAGLSAAFDPQFRLSRIVTTAFGIVIIGVQGLLTIILLIAIIIGAATTYMSITRDQDPEEFKPQPWRPMRKRYLEHVGKSALDLPPEPRSSPQLEPEELQEPSFNVLSVRRYPKIEDEDEGNRLFCPSDQSIVSSSASDHQTSSAWMSRSASVQSQVTYCSNLPCGARAIRPTWSLVDSSMEQE